MNATIDTSIKELLNSKLKKLEELLHADVLVYTGNLGPISPVAFMRIIEELVDSEDENRKLYVLLTTNGGSVEIVERYVNILRKHYSEVNFIVPDYAYSAGTVFCMSGDNILMDYFSVLGPIDPQVPNKEGNFVAALGYLDKVNEFIQKAQNNTLTKAELIWMKEIDLGQLRQFEQARDLTIDLLKTWLVEYKFKNWTVHKNKEKVTLEQKKNRAEEIAVQLSDNKKWKSHGRAIDIKELTALKLKIDDYGVDSEKQNAIRDYYYTMTEYLGMTRFPTFIHTRKFI